METIQSPRGETGMLIRRPVKEVFNAFVDPAVTTKFWFTKSSGRLEKGKTATWRWEMYDVEADVEVKDLVQDEKIEIRWGGAGQDKTRAEWTFQPFGSDATFVNIMVDGFSGDAETILAKVSDQVGGFCWVLAGLKAWLEHQLQLNLVADRFPTGKTT